LSGHESSDAPRRRRLSRSGDFDRVYREGSSRGNRFLVVYRFDRSGADDGPARLGISVGRKIGKAVTRNKVKRRIREAFWQLADDLPAGDDYVIVARPGVETLVDGGGTAGLKDSLADLLSGEPGPEEGATEAGGEDEERLS
jgi:ribonuclease P protein component